MTKYYKLTNDSEVHHGFQYKDGLNSDIVPFNTTDSCCAGGLYYTDAENIINFYDENSRWIREVTIPEGETQVVKDPDSSPQKWRSHSVICAKRKDLYEVDTWKWMKEQGINISDYALRYSASNGKKEVVEYLLSCKDLNFSQNAIVYALCYSAGNGKKEVVEYLLSCKDLKFSQNAIDYALRNSAVNGYKEVVSLLLSCKDLNFSQDAIDNALRYSAYNGKKEVVEYLLSCKDLNISLFTKLKYKTKLQIRKILDNLSKL